MSAKELGSIFEIDDDALETDWDNFVDLIVDINQFALDNEGSGHMFVYEDSLGCDGDIQRSPRVGWAAYADDGNKKLIKKWTMRLGDLRKSVNDIFSSKKISDGDAEIFKLSMKSEAGRHWFVKYIQDKLNS
jgi:hypothetical protein